MLKWFAQGRSRHPGETETPSRRPAESRRRRRRSVLALEELEKRVLLATYYVSPTGNDNNSGTSTSKPWRSINKVNSFDFAPGDTIRFQGGKNFNGSLFFDSSDNGTSASPITIDSYGSGRATIRSGTNSGIFVYNTAGYVINNLNFVGVGQNISQVDGVIFFTDLTGVEHQRIEISDVEVSQYGWEGISIFAYGTGSGYRNVRVTNSKLHHNLSSGMATYGPGIGNLSSYKAIRDVYIGHVESYLNAGNSNHEEGRAGNGVVLGSVDGAVVERSLMHDNGVNTGGNITGSGNAGIVVYNANNVVVQYNEVYRQRTVDINDGGGIDFDWGVSNSVMQYNYTHDNHGFGLMLLGFQGYYSTNVTMRYNISQNDARKNFGSILLWGLNGAQVHNNTVYLTSSGTNPLAAALLLWGESTTVRIRNNIFQTAGGARLVLAVPEIVGSDLLLQDNAYWSSGAAFVIDWNSTTYSSMAAWQTATNQEKINGTPVGHQVNPQLTSPGQGGTIGNADLLANLSAYKLQSTSPLKDAGTNLQTAFGVDPGPRDFYGNLLAGVTAFSIGAHEL